MLTLILISGSIVAAVLYRAIVSLLGQIPDRNLDFNAFMADTGIDRVSLVASNASRQIKPVGANGKQRRMSNPVVFSRRIK